MENSPRREEAVTEEKGVSGEGNLRHANAELEEEDMDCVSDNDQMEIELGLDSELGMVSSLSDLLEEFKDIMSQKVNQFGNQDTLGAFTKAIKRVNSVGNSNALNSLLHTVGSTIAPCRGRNAMIRCQPTSIARRAPGVPRGAAAVGKGRRPNALAGAKKVKRKRNLALAISQNHANAKSHGTGH